MSQSLWAKPQTSPESGEPLEKSVVVGMGAGGVAQGLSLARPLTNRVTLSKLLTLPELLWGGGKQTDQRRQSNQVRLSSPRATCVALASESHHRTLWQPAAPPARPPPALSHGFRVPSARAEQTLGRHRLRLWAERIQGCPVSSGNG